MKNQDKSIMISNNIITTTIDGKRTYKETNEKQKTILLVEDEGIIALSQAMKLKEYGYKVIHVQKGQKAIEAVNNGYKIDLILMDINLGEELDGTEIAKIILKDHDIPLLFLTNHTELEIVNKTENITSYGYVVKESGITVLDASIKMAFRLHDANLKLINQRLLTENQKNNLEIYEKRYRRLFEAAKDGIIILNADNAMITDVNPFLINMLGYTKEQFLTKHIWDISAKENVDESKLLFRELQVKGYVRYEDLPLESIDGKQIHVEFVSNVYLVDNKKVIQCNIRDITERNKQQKILSDEDEKKDALLKEIQHRTKNSFQMITSLLHLRAATAKLNETKITLNDLAIRIKSISDLYSLLYETDSFYEVQLNTYCNKLIGSMLNLSKNIVINEYFEEITVSAEKAATIGMILVELLSNIIKYAFPDSQAGIIHIEIKKANSNITLVVQDNGVGLPKDFNLERLESTGLQLVNMMVSQLDAKIKFISKNGLKVIIEFPRQNIS